jgi:hypothetical protein
MDRRGFMRLFAGGVAGIALGQAIPFNRVWSFPKEIVVPRFPRLFTIVETFVDPKFIEYRVVEFVGNPSRSIVTAITADPQILKRGDVFSIAGVNRR